MIRTIVVDNEKPSREVICNYLNEFCRDVEIVTTASSIKSAYKAIKNSEPDLVFLETEMPDGKGFDLLKMFDKVSFHVVFVSTCQDHAFMAFRNNATDYLLKPVNIEELKSAVDKVKKNGTKSHELLNFSELIKGLTETNNHQPIVVIPHIKGFEILKIAEIIMCKADGYCTHFFLVGNRKITSSKNLKNFEELYFKHGFMRVHHSYIVNLKHICSYSNQGEIILTEDNKAFLGDSYKKQFIKLYH